MKGIICLLLVLAASAAPAGQVAEPSGTLRIEVHSENAAVPHASVVLNGVTHTTDADGLLVVALPSGSVDLTAVKEGFNAVTTTVRVAAGREQRVVIELSESLEEEITVVASTRADVRIEDVPIRIEVVPREEIDEKVVMSPGDISMLLAETNGMRVQVTSPSLGAAAVRVQGLRGRYTQVLADGLPLYGQAGSIGMLQIPPLDLGQLEVIKGVASALYGASALGGVINLISRRPLPDRQERELLLNQTSRGGTDAVGWLSAAGDRWAYTLLGGGHVQQRTDVNRDGWTDLPGYERVVVRPRVFWEDGAGRSVFLTVGAMVEDRRGGTTAGAVTPDGEAFAESLGTRRFDAGLVARFLTPGNRMLSIRSSGLGQWHRHRFGDAAERDFHHTWLGEASVNGTSGGHTWVVGAAVQRDTYRGRDLPAFDYTYTAPGVFAQDDYAFASWATVSASGRLDIHNEAGTFFSPRLSLLIKPHPQWTGRFSTGTGFFAPTPFTEETEATGLSRLAPLAGLEAERGRSASMDLGWKRGAFEVTGTLFRSAIDRALLLRDAHRANDAARVEIVNASGPSRTIGSELLMRVHRRPIDLLVTYMFVRGTEIDPDTGARRPVPLNPAHSAGFDWIWTREGRSRLGIEFFYTGRQHLEDSPFATRSEPYLVWGVLGEWHVGRHLVYINSENLANVRQSDYGPVVRPSRSREGLWTIDAWAPVEGRLLNAGVRLRF